MPLRSCGRVLDTQTCLLTQTAFTFGGGNTDKAVDMVVDSSSNIYLVGNTISTDFILSGQDVTLWKFTMTGSLEWGKRFGATSQETASGVDVDSDGNPYVVGFSDSGDIS